MVLRAVDDGRDEASIPVPRESSPFEVGSDGAGYLVFRATGGLYDARPSGLRRITAGALLAVGPTRWLTLECDDRHRCRSAVVDRGTGARRAVAATLSANAPPGVIAPDGATAALFDTAPDGTVTLYLLDLASGRSRPIDWPIEQAVGDGTAVWSPDSRWLFSAGADGAIYAVDRATARVTPLGVSLPALTQLAVRPAAG